MGAGYLLLASVVLDVELNATELDYVSAAKLVVLETIRGWFTYEVVLSRLRVSYDHEHLVVDVFVSDRVPFGVSWGHRHDGVVFNLELAVSLPHDDHRLGTWVDVFCLGADADKLDVIVHPKDFAASLGLDVFLGNIFTLVVEQPV